MDAFAHIADERRTLAGWRSPAALAQLSGDGVPMLRRRLVSSGTARGSRR